MTPKPVRADLHCHSTASQVAKLGISRSIGLPECATPPQEVYELAKSRGMDFVTITDHDTIDGALEIDHLPDVFVSEELTTWFRGERHAVHVLCWGIDGADHEFLQSNARDLETCAAYLAEHDIACGLAHPFFSVAAPLEPRHRRRLAELFGVWETRNGSRAPELNAPAAIYLETRGGSESGGSDDHAGVDIGRTYTQTPYAATPADFLDHVRAGHAQAGGEQGSAAKWAHAALALAVRSLSSEPAMSAGADAQAADESQVSKRAVTAGAILELARRVVADGGERGGSGDSEISPDEASGLLGAWLDSVGFASDPAGLLDTLKADGFRHSELERRARRIHETRLADAAASVTAAVEDPARLPAAAEQLTSAFIPAIPYVASATVLGGERARLRRRDPGDRPRVALVVDGAGSMHGVTHTVEWVRERGVPGWDVEVVGTDARVDRRLPAVAELETPFYPGLELGVPSAPELVETLAGGDYDLVHLTAPGPAGVMAAVAAKIAAKPLAISHHTDLVGYARARSGDPGVAATAAFALRSFLEQADVVLSPSEPADRSVEELGIDPVAVARWGRGVDLELYDPGKRDPDLLPGAVSVLYVGRLSREKGVDLLAEGFELARERDPRLHLVIAGGGPEEQALRDRLGDSATFLGWVEREELAKVYASADVFCFASRTDTYGQVITEAQASGLPVVAVAEGGPAELIRHGADGYLCRADACEIASAIAQLGASPYLRGALGDGGRAATRARDWTRSLEQLGRGYELGVARARRRTGGAGAAHRAA